MMNSINLGMSVNIPVQELISNSSALRSGSNDLLCKFEEGKEIGSRSSLNEIDVRESSWTILGIIRKLSQNNTDVLSDNVRNELNTINPEISKKIETHLETPNNLLFLRDLVTLLIGIIIGMILQQKL